MGKHSGDVKEETEFVSMEVVAQDEPEQETFDDESAARTIKPRYRYDVRPGRRRFLHEAQLITRHVIPGLHRGVVVESELEYPPTRPGRLWAKITGQRMVRRALRNDVRSAQPWTL